MQGPDEASLDKIGMEKPQVHQATDTELLSGPLFGLNGLGTWLEPEIGREHKGGGMLGEQQEDMATEEALHLSAHSWAL